MRLIAVVAGCIMLAGCATGEVDSALQGKPGVDVSRDSSGTPFIGSVDFNRSGHDLQEDDLPLCLARNVRNASVTLRSSSPTYISPFTGTAYSSTEASEVSGGEVLLYVSKDGMEAAAQGVEQYQPRLAGMSNDAYLRYSLGVRVSSGGTLYRFDRLQQALRDSGVASQPGFSKLGAWSSSDPVASYAALETLVDRIDGCLSSR